MNNDLKYVDNNVVINKYNQAGIDFIPDEVKVLDFEHLNYGEKKCLYALNSICGFYNDSYTFKNYEEGKISIYKNEDIWQVYLVINGKAFYFASFTNAYEACEYFLRNIPVQDLLVRFNNAVVSAINDDVIEEFIDKLKAEYKIINETKHL